MVSSRKTKTDAPAPSVVTPNPFQLLQDAPEDVNTVRNKKIHIPPIVLDGTPGDIRAFLAEIRKISKLDFHIRSRATGTTIHLQSKEDHQNVCKALTEKGTGFHTYGFREERNRRYVLHGIPETFEPEEIHDELKSHIPNGVVNVWQFKKSDPTGKRTLLPVFGVSTSASITLKELNKINYVLYHRVHFQRYDQPSDITQCFKCQRFDHVSKYCHLRERCVRCGENHNVKDCDRENRKVHCANCGDDHVASYRKCKERVKIISVREIKKAPLVRSSTNRTTTRSSTFQPGAVSFAAVAAGKPAAPQSVPRTAQPTASDHLSNTANLLKDARDIFHEMEEMNLFNIISELKCMLSELRTAAAPLDRINIMVRYAHLFDGSSP